jgi:hypothetical protein
MVYTLPSHDPSTGTVAPSSWGDEINANFDVLTQVFIPLFPETGNGIAPASGLTAAAVSDVQSSTGDTIKPEWPVISFDDSSDEGRIWNAQIGRNYVAGNVIVVAGSFYMASANVDDEVVIVAQIAAVSSADASVTAKSFDTANSSIQNVPNAAGTERNFSITLTNDDSIAPLDRFSLVFWRDGDDGDDTADGDFQLTQLRIAYDLDS